MTKKYEFTGEVKEWVGRTLHRIRAVRGFTLKSGKKVAKGDLGGWIEKEENLSHTDSAWVYGDARVHDNAKVYGNAEVSGDAWVHSKARVGDNAQVFGDAQVYGYAEVSGNSRVYGYAKVYGNAEVSGDADIYGNAMVYDNAKVYGCARVYGDADIYGYAWVYGGALVYGNARIGGDARVEKSSDVIWFKNIWSSGRTFTYTRSNGKWTVGCFHGTGEELIKKAYADSEVSSKCYETIVRATEEIYKAIEKKELEK